MLSSRLASRHPHDVSSSLLPFRRTRDVIFLAAAHGYFRVVRTSCNLRIISNRVLRFSTQRWLFFVGQVAQYIVGSPRVEKTTSLRGKSATSHLLCFIRKTVTQFISPEKREGTTLHQLKYDAVRIRPLVVSSSELERRPLELSKLLLDGIVLITKVSLFPVMKLSLTRYWENCCTEVISCILSDLTNWIEP